MRSWICGGTANWTLVIAFLRTPVSVASTSGVARRMPARVVAAAADSLTAARLSSENVR